MVQIDLSEMIAQAGPSRTHPPDVATPASNQRWHRLVHRLYERLEAEIAARQPVCTNRGECCKFDSFGHRLYVTRLELEYFIDHQQPHGLLPVNRGACPYQIANRCTARQHRPLGCRVFFCDPDSSHWQPPLYERYLSRLKRIAARYGIACQYAEWLYMLSDAADE